MLSQTAKTHKSECQWLQVSACESLTLWYCNFFKICATVLLPTSCTTAPILQTTFIAAVQRPDLCGLRAADKLQTQKRVARKKHFRYNYTTRGKNQELTNPVGCVHLLTERMIHLSILIFSRSGPFYFGKTAILFFMQLY